MRNFSNLFESRQEMILLAALIAVGLGGLIALQWAQQAPAKLSEERSVVQSAAQKSESPQPEAPPVQRVRGDLVDRDEEYPEVGQPFTFRLTNCSPGAIFELDPGDGSPRQVFRNGQLRYTYKRAGSYQISLWAKFEGEEVKLKTITKKVKVPPPVKRVQVGGLVDF